MKLSEMIALIGDENITVQNLLDSSSSIDWSAKKKRCTLKFETCQIGQSDLLSGQFKRVALVIWFDLALYKQRLSESQK